MTEDPFSETPIGRCFAGARETSDFADFDDYSPSDEPASFLGAAVLNEEGHFEGCLMVQLSLSEINREMTDRSNLGRTGEHYLVNSDKRMLTESRFISDSILKETVDTKSAESALQGRAGEGFIRDYRGVYVLSCYTFIDIGSVRWAILVEVDLDEIVMDMSETDRKELFRKVARVIDRAIDCSRISLEILDPTRDASNVARFYQYEGQSFTEVETGTFRRAKDTDLLFAAGVATCTAVTVSGDDLYYLAHVSPVDISYGLDDHTRQALGSLATDLIGEIMADIRSHPGFSEDTVASFTIGICAVHDESFEPLVTELLSQGLSLANIRFIHNRGPKSLNIVFDPAHNAAYTQWNVVEDAESADKEKFYNIYGVIKPLDHIISDILRNELNVVYLEREDRCSFEEPRRTAGSAAAFLPCTVDTLYRERALMLFSSVSFETISA